MDAKLAMRAKLTRQGILSWFERALERSPGVVPLMILVGTEEGQLGFLHSPEWLATMKENESFREGLHEAVERLFEACP